MNVIYLNLMSFVLLTFSIAAVASTKLTSANKAKTINFSSFNVGLAHGYIAYSKERLPVIVKHLKQSKSDVICLQEVWKKADRTQIIKDLKKQYPHSFYSPTTNKQTIKQPSCKPWTIIGKGKFINCLFNNCISKKGSKFTGCVVKTCKEPLDRLKNTDKECANALLAQVGKSPLASVATVLNPFKAANLFTYEGSTGLLLLSKQPLINKEILSLEDISNLTKRAVLMASIIANEKEIKLSCTHLTSDLSNTAPYTGNFKSWGAENAEQIKTLLDHIKADRLPHILMGDFNCSFANEQKNTEPELESNCEKILSNNFSLGLEKQIPSCSFCTNNKLVNTKKDVLLDHIFAKNIKRISTKLIYNLPVNLKLGPKKDIEIKTVHLSDHYGVESIFEIP